jgi:uncharacterized membrane protein YczE
VLTLVGFAVGYAVGCQQGKEGYDKLMRSIATVRHSDEFAAAIETARSLFGSVLRQAFEMGSGVVAGEVKSAGRRLRVA